MFFMIITPQVILQESSAKEVLYLFAYTVVKKWYAK